MMQRERFDITVSSFLDTMKRVQEGYLQQGDASPEGAPALSQLTPACDIV